MEAGDFWTVDEHVLARFVGPSFWFLDVDHDKISVICDRNIANIELPEERIVNQYPIMNRTEHTSRRNDQKPQRKPPIEP